MTDNPFDRHLTPYVTAVVDVHLREVHPDKA